MKKYIAAQYIDDEEVNAAFWHTLEAVVVLLKPFQEATDEVQRDRATLMAFYNAFTTMKNSLQAVINANGLLKLAAQDAIHELQDKWDKYVNDKLETCVRYLLYGRRAMVRAEMVVPSQRWLFAWAQLYFDGMGIAFYAADNTQEDKKTVETHLKSEFAKLKAEEIENDVSWRTWWMLNRERYPHLFHIAAAFLSLCATEASVERSFSKQGFIHSARRNRSSDALIEAQMMISFNYVNIHCGAAATVEDPDEEQVSLDEVEARDSEEEGKMAVDRGGQLTVSQFFRPSSSSSSDSSSSSSDSAMPSPLSEVMRL